MGTNTGIGIGIGIPFKNNALGGDRPYLPPELKARLIGVWDNYGKKNTDADRNIIKNKIPNAGGDLEILNSAYRLNSGFGGYSNDFQEYTYNENVVVKDNTNAIFNKGGQLLVPYSLMTKNIPSFKIKVSGLSETYHFRYYYRDNNGVQHSVNMAKDGNYELPICYNVQNSSDGTNCGFANNGSDIITVEILPTFEGALVTDGINDIIASIKTLEEWNIGDKGITIVSMIHQINTNSNNFITTNNIRTDNKVIGRNIVSNIEKTGIYGWYKENIQSDTINVINNILGDKNDYISHSSPSTNINPINNSKFYVQGYAIENGFAEISSIAHYWTFAVLGKATEDEINLIIGNYNLDRSLKPDILCNTIKQGITNENHAEFGDKLIDYSGNGRDIQLNNIAWKGDSGIGKYVEDFTTWYGSTGVLQTFSKIEVTDGFKHNWVITRRSGESAINSFKVLIKGIPENGYIQYRYFESEDATKKSSIDIYEDGEYSLPNSTLNNLNDLVGFQLFAKIPPLDSQSFIGLTITQIPSHAGALCLDGVNDFGKVTGMPIYKDYTFIIDREIISIGNTNGIVASKSEDSTDVNKQGAFLFEYLGAPNNISAWSFYKDNGKVANTDFTRGISYQSKYSYNGTELLAGTAFDSDKLWLGILRDKDSRFANVAIYSLMSFPYSMSEFLIERQLKKHKLGTLYPDMVEFRPIVKSNVKWNIIEIWQGDKSLYRPAANYDKTGIYLKKDSTIGIYVKPYVGQKVSEIVYNGVSYTDLKLNSNGFYYKVVPITKSPQKITMTIEQDENYVKFEPVITSNVEYVRLDFYLNNYQKRINIGDYIPKDAYLRANFYLKNNVDELTVFTFNGVNIDYERSIADDTAFNIGSIYNYDSPQNINITIDEYIRYEDIVQPYPVLLRFKDESDKEVSYGDKIKVGSSITRIGSFNDCNLLKGIYTVSNAKLNGSPLPSTPHVVEKQMVFTCTATYLLDDNEPKCILSPSRLRIPNSSYKLLGYIPDISGHGNHGKINNSAYAGASGANGYPYDYNNSSFWCDSVLAKVVSGELIEYFAVKNSTGFSNITSGVYKGEIKVTGVTKAISENKISRLRIYTNSTTDNELIDITQDGNYNIDIKGVGDANRVFFYAIPNNPNESIVVRLTEPIYIEQVGEYEGAYCLDGVNDFVTIPTLSRGGKQVLMKVNWSTEVAKGCLYDQRKNIDVYEFAIFNLNTNNTGVSVPAYQARNDGKTYIDGILNNNILAGDLKQVLHNITITNELVRNADTVSPTIGNTVGSAYYTNMALYDFMLFDEISTDEEILNLNKYIGIEPKVELPPYY